MKHPDPAINEFLAEYGENVHESALQVRKLLYKNLPGIIEQLDLPAKMIAYCYGQKYIEMIAMLIPSKRGLKLSFYNGISLPDPDHALRGKAKTTRYIEIKSGTEPDDLVISGLVKSAFKAYEERCKIAAKHKP